MTAEQTKFAFEEILKQGLKATEILNVICHLKRREHSLLRRMVEQAEKYEALWAADIILDFLTLEEIDLI
jgi:hypothetical protein